MTDQCTREWYDKTFLKPGLHEQLASYRDVYSANMGNGSWWPVAIMRTGQRKYPQKIDGSLMPKGFAADIMQKETKEELIKKHSRQIFDVWDQTKPWRYLLRTEVDHYNERAAKISVEVQHKPLAACIMQLGWNRAPDSWGEDPVPVWVLETAWEDLTFEEFADFTGQILADNAFDVIQTGLEQLEIEDDNADEETDAAFPDLNTEESVDFSA